VSISHIHSSCCLRVVDKALLSKLRKKTGISFLNCKKALEQFDNDINKVCFLVDVKTVNVLYLYFFLIKEQS